jgi:hypothetical protein
MRALFGLANQSWLSVTSVIVARSVNDLSCTSVA